VFGGGSPTIIQNTENVSFLKRYRLKKMGGGVWCFVRCAMDFPGHASILGLCDNIAREHNYTVTRLSKE